MSTKISRQALIAVAVLLLAGICMTVPAFAGEPKIDEATMKEYTDACVNKMWLSLLFFIPAIIALLVGFKFGEGGTKVAEAVCCVSSFLAVCNLATAMVTYMAVLMAGTGAEFTPIFVPIFFH